jgi:hypothetical protein
MMTKILVAALFGICGGPVIAGDVAVSITVGQPGFFGQINLGSVPPPPVVYAQPVVVQQAPEYISAPPIYLHVPPGHEKHWSKHCAEYHACGRRVYFVRDDWYNNEYVPRYQHEHGDHGHGEGHDKDHGHDHDQGHDQGHNQ